MNILYNGCDPNNDISVSKDVWYSTYMAYALQHGIIDTDLSSRQAKKITRSEYVYMFSRAEVATILVRMMDPLYRVKK